MKNEFTKFKFKLISVVFGALFSSAAFAGEKSIAREWNDILLQAIRYDYARPTVTARNLYHLSILLYDAFAAYDPQVPNFFITIEKTSTQLELDRKITTSYAAYTFIKARFKDAPKATEINKICDELMRRLELDPTFNLQDESAAGSGITMARMVLDQFQFDGSLEQEQYETPPTEFLPLNPPLMVKEPGVSGLYNVNAWQMLALETQIDQGGNPIPGKIQHPLTLHWGRVRPFALTAKDQNPDTLLYFDPGLAPQFGGVGHEEFVEAMVQVIEYSSWLDPSDGVEMDISPAKIGNNPLGSNKGSGHALNPITGLAYAPNVVRRADYARVLAEFWADGPQSETPPGHWNVVANQSCEKEGFTHRWFGVGPELSVHEWDVKLYLTLNGALHDVAISVWGIKGYYQASRPISAIRYLGTLGQSSDKNLPSYHPQGLPLKAGLIEVITEADTRPGQRMAHLVGQEGQIAIRSWRGAPSDPIKPNRGVDWILADSWLPYQKPTFVTPPFPGYVSGHSTFSRAAAEVLTAVTGSPYFPGGLGQYSFEKNKALTFETGPSKNISLQWATYYDAADQSALSRIYGGIHGRFDDIPGRKIGYTIGRRALAKMQRFWNQ